MSILNIGYTGLQAAQAHLNATAMNTANALTVGYTRQRAEQSAISADAHAGLIAGNGVAVNGIRRVADQYLISQQWRAGSNFEYYNTMQQYLGPLESIIGDKDTGIGNGLNNFFAVLDEATTQSSSSALRQQIITEAGSLSNRFNSMVNFIAEQKKGIQSQRSSMIEHVNTLAGNISTFNQKIQELESTGGNTNVLRDQRDELVKQLGTMIDVRVSEDASGGYTVALPSGEPLVSGRTASTLKVKSLSDGSQAIELTFSGSVFTVDMSAGGQLGALYDYEVGPLAEMYDSLVGMAESLAKEFNDQLANGFDMDGNPGKPLFIFDINNPKGMLQINPDLSANELALSGDANEPGNGDNLQALIGLKNKALDIPGLGNMSLSEGAASIVSSVGIVSRQMITEAQSAASVLQQTELQRDNLSAVNVDEEAMNLMTYTKIYQANSKVISAGDRILNDLLMMF